MNTELEQPNAKGAKEARKTRNPTEHFGHDFSHEIIGAAVEVQRELGTGLLESAYAAALAIELDARGLTFEREVPVRARYKGRDIGIAYRADFIVQGAVILEIKAASFPIDVHRAQLLSYVKLAGVGLGLLINFNDMPLTKTIQRVVNNI